MTDRTATTIHDLVAEYIRRAEAIILRGGEPAFPDLMQDVLAAHPEIAVDFRSFARMCAAAMRYAAESQNVEADELARELERRRGEPLSEA
jgi:hypothetical protein